MEGAVARKVSVFLLLATVLVFAGFVHYAEAVEFALDYESWEAYTAREVQDLINAGADVNARNNQGITVLMFAAWDGSAEVVELLINAGADINARDDDDMTVLMFAAWSSSAEVVELLINAGADINAKDDEDWTPLIFAADDNTAEVSMTSPGCTPFQGGMPRPPLPSMGG